MAKKPTHKMSIENRAKQFMPFAALKGLEEALEKKEKEIELKNSISSSYADIKDPS